MPANWSSLLAQIWAWLVTLLVGGGIGGVTALGLFKWLGAKWLDARFQRDLEAFKAKKNEELEGLKTDYIKEVERLKGEIGRLLDRAVKFNALEYERLPIAWEYLNKAFFAVLDLSPIMRMTKTPFLDQYSSENLMRFLRGVDLSEVEKQEVQLASKKGLLYAELCFQRDVRRASQVILDCENYIIANSIFMDEEIAQKMTNVHFELRNALVDAQFSSDFGDGAEFEKAKKEGLLENLQKHLDNASILRREIKELIRTGMARTSLD